MIIFAIFNHIMQRADNFFIQCFSKICYAHYMPDIGKSITVGLSGMRFFRGGQVAIAVVTRALIDSVHATEDDCDDIAGLPGRAEGAVVSVTIRELLDGRSKISVRSNPEVDACAICAVYGGGGHKMASGCTLDCGTETAVEKILAAIDQVWPA